MTALKDILKDPDMADIIAEMCWHLYVKLKEKGFTDEQATQIVTGYSRPTK